MKSISILGCGWLGLPLGEYLVKQGYRVMGSTTRAEKLPLIEAAGMAAFVVNVVGEDWSPEDVQAFFDCDVLVINIPPGRRQPGVEERYPQQMMAIGEAAKKYGTKHVLFVGSTGVYPANRQVVRTTEEVAPATASGRALLAAEKYWQEGKKWSTTVLRLAGLIGGQRHPGRWFAGKKDLAGAKVPVNLIHREDCIAAIEAIIVQKKWGEVYHLCADEHPLKSVYYPLMAKRLGLEAPVYKEEETPAPYKIISNEKIKEALGLVLSYPDLSQSAGPNSYR